VKKLLIRLFLLIHFDTMVNKLISLYEHVKISRYEKLSGCIINYVGQGGGGITITGDLKKFRIDSTSHLKSGTFIECSGGVTIGRYFHPGRGLTIFSANHNYNSDRSIPYDEIIVEQPVAIKDFVWVGANVTIVPGVTIGEGCIIGAGSVVTRNVPDFAIVCGNPAQVIKFRDIEKFNKLKTEGKWY